jgi:apolipoprotein N-acyltransferase
VLRRIFLGKLSHWVLIVAFCCLLWWMGEAQLQTRDYNVFLGTLVAVTAAIVLFVCLTHRRGERVTREPFEDPPDGPEPT